MANLKQPLSQNIITVLGPDLVSLLDYDFESGTLLRVKFQYATRLSTFASSLSTVNSRFVFSRPTPIPDPEERGGSQSTHSTTSAPDKATDGKRKGRRRRRYLLEFAPGGMLFSVRWDMRQRRFVRRCEVNYTLGERNLGQCCVNCVMCWCKGKFL